MDNNKDKEILQDAEENNNEDSETQEDSSSTSHPEEIGGPKGAEPTRYGDWEINGRCYDF